MRLLSASLALLLVIAGCAAPRDGTATDAASQRGDLIESVQPPPTESLSAVPATGGTDPADARALFPAADLEVTYHFADNTGSRELLIPDGDRLVQTYDGVPYITWFFTPEGVFRPDLSDPDRKQLVRYLPARLEDGLVWQQQGHRDTYWFRLRAIDRCEGQVVTFSHCWRLEVLARQGLTTFFLAPSMGVISAIGDYQDAAESFAKQLTGHAPASLPKAERQAYLERGLALSEAVRPKEQRVRAGSVAEFQAQLDWHNERPRCGTPSDGRPVLPGAQGRVTFRCGGKLWSLDLADGKQSVLYAHPADILHYAWEPQGRGIGLSVLHAGDLLYWEAASGLVRGVRAGMDDLPPVVQWSPEGSILVASLGTSPSRAYELFDRATGEALGKSSGKGLRWSADGRRFAVEQGDIAVTPTTPGHTLIVGEIVGGKPMERVIGVGNQESDFRVVGFVADGTLIYRESLPWRDEQISYWALPPGLDAQPTRLGESSALVHAAQQRGPTEGTVDERRIRRLGDSPDGQWTLFLFTSYGEIYLIKSDLTGPFVRVPGADATWDPR